MDRITLEPLRWMDESARISILTIDGSPKGYFQITGWRDIETACVGRPVEELPRILTMFSGSHHLVSAMALDRLFQVQPPALAINLRDALLHTQFVTHHLRKLYFYLCSMENPFLTYPVREAPGTRSVVPHGLLDRVMDHVALSQEAAGILGGRPDHPVSAVAGGVGRFLKEPHYARLAEIAHTCLEFSIELAAFLGQRVLEDRDIAEGFVPAHFPRMSGLTITEGTDNIAVRHPSGSQEDHITLDEIFRKVAFQQEAWTYKPFAYLKEKGWNPVETEDGEGRFFVGPLARLNRGHELPSPRAEEERQRLIEHLGQFPQFSVVAAYRSLMVELIQAAERMVDLCVQEKLTGPAIRVMPSDMNGQALAAIESPEGLIAHYYETDERGLVRQIQVLDASIANNALRCLLVRNAVEESKGSLADPKRIKSKIETSLLPF
jgi:F420-non-reducing hydrogenase large subunit